jgi:hypothetical protein
MIVVKLTIKLSMKLSMKIIPVKIQGSETHPSDPCSVEGGGVKNLLVNFKLGLNN